MMYLVCATKRACEAYEGGALRVLYRVGVPYELALAAARVHQITNGSGDCATAAGASRSLMKTVFNGEE
jgi:hypothetical protein